MGCQRTQFKHLTFGPTAVTRNTLMPELIRKNLTSRHCLHSKVFMFQHDSTSIESRHYNDLVVSLVGL